MASLPVSTTTRVVPFGRLAERSRAFGEPKALLATREAAARMLDPLVLPDRARHLWRYTNPELFVPRADPTQPSPTDVSFAWRLEGPRSAAALVAGGATHLVELDEAARAAGVRVLDLHTAGEAVALLGQAVPANHGFVEAINAAAWAGGGEHRLGDREG
ncbi:MAG TPA: hypothetical protein PLS53_17435, partial [Thermoanaerobaculaceae bacterium]|nr:hypothetical protein [Thermoanaerobaculaceae bacterium]